MLPHMDQLSSARITPSVQTYESFTLDKTGKAITFLETCLSGVKAPPTPRIAQKTPYTGGDLMFTRDPNNGVPGVGSYEAEVSFCDQACYCNLHSFLDLNCKEVVTPVN